MGRHGKGMRDCCDSVDHPRRPHIVGCTGYRREVHDTTYLLKQARLWIAGQPYTRTAEISTKSQMIDALTDAIGEPLEGWD